MEITKLYRVQGGVFPCKSRESILVEGQAISCNYQYDIYIGDEEYLSHFLKVRCKAKGAGNLPKKIGDFGLTVIELSVPKMFAEMLDKYSVGQFKAKTKYPRKVDPKTPGKAYQVTDTWSKLLEQVCLHAKHTPVLSREDFFEIIKSPSFERINNINFKQVANTFNECGVSKSDAIYFLKNLSLSLQSKLFSKNKKSEVQEIC